MRVLVTGGGGGLGAYLLETCLGGTHGIVAWGRTDGVGPGGTPIRGVDLGSADLEAALGADRPDAIIHLGALSSAEAVRLDPELGRRVNVEATRRLAEWSARHGARLVFASTDLVFDGSRPWNREDDPAGPILAYGRTKREAESAVLASPGGVVARLSLLYGFSRSGRPAYFDRTVAALRRGERQALFEDEYRTPLDLGSAARAMVGLVEVGATGIVHVGGGERMSRHDLIRRAAEALGIDPGLVVANRRSDVVLPEPRPADVSLDTTRLAGLLPGLVRPSIEEVLRG